MESRFQNPKSGIQNTESVTRNLEFENPQPGIQNPESRIRYLEYHNMLRDYGLGDDDKLQWFMNVYRILVEICMKPKGSEYELGLSDDSIDNQLTLNEQ